MSFRIIGRITNAHGLDGGLQVHLTVPDHTFLSSLKILFAGKDDYPDDAFHIRDVATQGNWIIIYPEEIHDRDQALKLKNWNVFVPAESVTPDTDEYIDLIGFEVRGMPGEQFIGSVTDILDDDRLAQPVLVVGHEGKEYLIPYVEEFIEDIDVDAQCITITLMDGLLDED